MFDGAGRADQSYVGYYTGTETKEPYDEVGIVTTDNLILEQSIITLDDASNTIKVARYQRFDPSQTSDTAGGALNARGRGS